MSVDVLFDSAGDGRVVGGQGRWGVLGIFCLSFADVLFGMLGVLL